MYTCYTFCSGGGPSDDKQLIEYDIQNDVFIDFGINYLDATLGNTEGEFGFGSYFTQINDTTLYTINPDGDSINVYHMDSLSYKQLGTTIPIETRDEGSISSSETPTPRLYITGGYYNGGLDDLQILSLWDLNWLSSLPSMTVERRQHGSIWLNNTLYAIGGLHVNSVQWINTKLLDSWSDPTAITLTCDLGNFGITAVDKVIYIIGGWCYDLGNASNTVQTIDTLTGAISTEILPSAVTYISAVTVGNTIYGFGGYITSWFTLDLLRITLLPDDPRICDVNNVITN